MFLSFSSLYNFKMFQDLRNSKKATPWALEDAQRCEFGLGSVPRGTCDQLFRPARLPAGQFWPKCQECSQIGLCNYRCIAAETNRFLLFSRSFFFCSFLLFWFLVAVVVVVVVVLLFLFLLGILFWHCFLLQFLSFSSFPFFVFLSSSFCSLALLPFLVWSLRLRIVFFVFCLP